MLKHIITTALLLASASALASTQTGQLVVTVKSPEGKPLAGAGLIVESPALIGPPREAQTTEDGTYRFTNLAPGTYQVTATAPNLSSAKATELLVQIGTTTPVELALKALDSETLEEVVITGQRTVVDTEKLSLGRAVTAEFLENSPIARDYQSVTLLMPGVLDVGGDGNPNILGGTDYGNQYLLDGINITDPVTNTFSANFNFDAMDQVEVITGGRDAEYGSAVGGVVNIVTKSGGNEHTLDASIFYQDDWMQKKTKAMKDARNTDMSANLNLGGPLMKDKLWYFASVEVPWTAGTIGNPPDGNPFGGTHPARDFKGVFGLAKVTWQQSDDHKLSLLFQLDPARIQNTIQSVQVQPGAEEDQVQTGYRLAATSDFYVTNDLLFTNRLAWTDGGLDVHPHSGDYETPGHYNLDDGTAFANDTTWYEDTRQRLQAQTALSYTLDGLFGEHQFKTGIDFAYSRNKVFNSIPGGMSFTDAGTGEGPTDVLPSQVTRLVEPQDTSIWGDTEGLFVQDIWKPVSNITIRPGVRFDSARMRNWEGDTQVVMNTFSPRFGVAWDPWDDKKTSIRAGYYQYVDTGYLTLSDFAGGNRMLTRTYDYNPVTGEYDQFQSVSGGPSGVVGKPYLKETWNQQRPRTHEFLLGVSREIMEDLGASADFIYRYSANQWEDTEENMIWSDDAQVIGYRDGTQRYIYSLGALRESFIRYYGVVLQAEKNLSDHWTVFGSYTWSKTEGTEPDIINESFDRPFMRQYEFGYLPGDVRHMVKIDGSYELPFGMTIGPQFRYYSGSPYNRYFQNSYYGDYGDRRALRGFDINGKELRMPSRYVLNARFGWDMEQLVGQRAELYVDVYNITNNRPITDVQQEDHGDGTFGEKQDRMNPISFSLAFRYRY